MDSPSRENSRKNTVEAFRLRARAWGMVLSSRCGCHFARVNAASPLMQVAQTAPHTRAALKILVVDDNYDTMRAAALWLKASGHDVREASDGLSALEIARAFRPEVLLLDIGLPGINSYMKSLKRCAAKDSPKKRLLRSQVMVKPRIKDGRKRLALITIW